MVWLSILPEQLSAFEAWVARFFIFLSAITIGPWAFLIVYDLILYLVRTILYELPAIGGRARGKRRPRAPSLTERPSGNKRHFNFVRPSPSADEDSAYASGQSFEDPHQIKTQNRSLEQET
ncbi:hypothetical protein IWX90DRAFT_275812 [Phyllosticta citrichinensis]|uniref:Uncharacterized protein n=1 Tax=Phyllosticta citrichinensis TaxID=1130410 RepID=A0ABR1XN91_9PEZI